MKVLSTFALSELKFLKNISGEKILRKLQQLEDKYPKFFGAIGDYPIQTFLSPKHHWFFGCLFVFAFFASPYRNVVQRVYNNFIETKPNEIYGVSMRELKEIHPEDNQLIAERVFDTLRVFHS